MNIGLWGTAIMASLPSQKTSFTKHDFSLSEHLLVEVDCRSFNGYRQAMGKSLGKNEIFLIDLPFLNHSKVRGSAKITIG
jgi:hypothetical protein